MSTGPRRDDSGTRKGTHATRAYQGGDVVPLPVPCNILLLEIDHAIVEDEGATALPVAVLSPLRSVQLVQRALQPGLVHRSWRRHFRRNLLGGGDRRKRSLRVVESWAVHVLVWHCGVHWGHQVRG